jgi:hypothetical protein
MAKWSDYCISKVRYDEDHTHIVALMVHEDHGTTMGAASQWSRQSVVNSIKSGKTFTTIIKNSDGKWLKGAEVTVVNVDGVDYLKTEPNKSKGDNLGNLPEF